MKLGFIVAIFVVFMLVGCSSTKTAEETIEAAELSAYENGSLDRYIHEYSYCDADCKLKFKEKLGFGLSYQNHIDYMQVLFTMSETGKEFKSFEILSSNELNENETYVEYRINYFNNSPRDDFAYMILINETWLINVEKELFE